MNRSEDGGRTEKVLLRDAVDALKGNLMGDRIWNEHPPPAASFATLMV